MSLLIFSKNQIGASLIFSILFTFSIYLRSNFVNNSLIKLEKYLHLKVIKSLSNNFIIWVISGLTSIDSFPLGNRFFFEWWVLCCETRDPVNILRRMLNFVCLFVLAGNNLVRFRWQVLPYRLWVLVSILVQFSGLGYVIWVSACQPVCDLGSGL